MPALERLSRTAKIGRSTVRSAMPVANRLKAATARHAARWCDLTTDLVESLRRHGRGRAPPDLRLLRRRGQRALRLDLAHAAGVRRGQQLLRSTPPTDTADCEDNLGGRGPARRCRRRGPGGGPGRTAVAGPRTAAVSPQPSAPRVRARSRRVGAPRRQLVPGVELPRHSRAEPGRPGRDHPATRLAAVAMNNRPRQGGSLVASPVLTGTVVVLVSIVAVFITYNAKDGLPFVPTYGVTFTVPDAGGLAAVARGAHRRQARGHRGGGPRRHGRGRQPVALVDVKLDETLEPIRDDSVVADQAALAAGGQVRAAASSAESGEPLGEGADAAAQPGAAHRGADRRLRRLRRERPARRSRT